jgi:hypothetical protein
VVGALPKWRVLKDDTTTWESAYTGLENKSERTTERMKEGEKRSILEGKFEGMETGKDRGMTAEKPTGNNEATLLNKRAVWW